MSKKMHTLGGDIVKWLTLLLALSAMNRGVKTWLKWCLYTQSLLHFEQIYVTDINKYLIKLCQREKAMFFR